MDEEQTAVAEPEAAPEAGPEAEPASAEGPSAEAGRIEQLTADLAAVQAERDAHAARVAELEAAHGEALSRGLDARRRALIAENAGQVVEELVQGATEEALDASVEVAKAAFARLSESVRGQLQAERVPGGGGQRAEEDTSQLSPFQKIVRGLSK